MEQRLVLSGISFLIILAVTLTVWAIYADDETPEQQTGVVEVDVDRAKVKAPKPPKAPAAPKGGRK